VFAFVVEARTAESCGSLDPHRPTYCGPRFGQWQAIAAFAEKWMAEAFVSARNLSAYRPFAEYRIVSAP